MHGELDGFDHPARVAELPNTVNVVLLAIVAATIVIDMIAVDEYVVDVLMRDLVAHDRAPSAFLVYLHLWSESEDFRRAR